MTTQNYYLKVLKNNPTFDWKEQEDYYSSASKHFLSLQDIDGDNVLHVFVRKHKATAEQKTSDASLNVDLRQLTFEFLQKLNERLWSDRNCNNLTPFEETIEKDHPFHGKLLYDFLAEHGRLDSFLDLKDQMSDIRYLVNLSHVFHGVAKASKSDDTMQVEKRIRKYNAIKEKIIELNVTKFMSAMVFSRKISRSLREDLPLLSKVFQIFWESDGELMKMLMN